MYMIKHLAYLLAMMSIVVFWDYKPGIFSSNDEQYISLKTWQDFSVCVGKHSMDIL